jgi:hypothetical protein
MEEGQEEEQEEEEEEEIEVESEIEVEMATQMYRGQYFQVLYPDNVKMLLFFTYSNFKGTDILEEKLPITESELKQYKEKNKILIFEDESTPIFEDGTGTTNLMISKYLFINLIENIYLGFNSYRSPYEPSRYYDYDYIPKVSDRKIEVYLEIYDTTEGPNKNKLLYYILTKLDDAVNLIKFNELNDNKFNFTIKIINNMPYYSAPGHTQIEPDDKPIKDIVLQLLLGNMMISTINLIKLLDYFKDIENKRIFNYIKSSNKITKLYEKKISLDEYRNAMLVFKLIIDYNKVSESMKDYNFDTIFELVQKSLNDLNRCADIVTRTEYIEIFNKMGFTLEGPSSKFEFLDKLKNIYVSIIKNSPDNIIRNLSKKRYIVRDFWINFKTYEKLAIDYRKRLCSVKPLQKTFDLLRAHSLKIERDNLLLRQESAPR